MCTLSWTRDQSSGGGESGYTLFFNRDEQRSRPPAVPPRRFENEMHRWVAATDPQGGGTWLASNDSGLSVALLNSYESVPDPEDSSPAGFRSRGKLVVEVVSQCERAEDGVRYLQSALPRAEYRPFYIAIIDLRGDVVRHWDGRGLRDHDAGEGFLSSSSFRPGEVIAWRREEFARRRDRESFHRQHDPEKPACSVLMSRPDAATVSLSKIDVSSGSGIRYFYAEGPDWKWNDPVCLSLYQHSVP